MAKESKQGVAVLEYIKCSSFSTEGKSKVKMTYKSRGSYLEKPQITILFEIHAQTLFPIS